MISEDFIKPTVRRRGAGVDFSGDSWRGHLRIHAHESGDWRRGPFTRRF